MQRLFGEIGEDRTFFHCEFTCIGKVICLHDTYVMTTGQCWALFFETAYIFKILLLGKRARDTREILGTILYTMSIFASRLY